MHINAIDLDNNLFYDNSEDLIESEEQIAEEIVNPTSAEADGFTAFYFAKPETRCLRHHTTEYEYVFNHENGKIEMPNECTKSSIVYKSLLHSKTNVSLCPHCGNSIGRLNYQRVSASQLGRTLATLIGYVLLFSIS